MHKTLAGLALVLGAIAIHRSAAADQVYKCKNAEGRLLYQKEPCSRDNETLNAWSQTYKTEPRLDAAEDEASAVTPLVLRQGFGGHYFVDGRINGKPLLFVIDTGASIVSLPESQAADAGVDCVKAIMVETANGKAEACVGVVREMHFGHFLIKDAQAMIVPNLSQPLLGMNVLQHFKIAQANGEMIITAPQAAEH